jgi:hypothetical protein
MPLSPKVRSERRAEAKRLQDPKILKRKRCDNCGDLFRPKKPYPVQKFCCDNCRKEFHANGGNAFGPLKARLERLVRQITLEDRRIFADAVARLEVRIAALESTPAPFLACPFCRGKVGGCERCHQTGRLVETPSQSPSQPSPSETTANRLAPPPRTRG